jgi:ribosomal RNA-processing protein 9
MDTKSVASVAICLPHIYTVTKDRYIVKWKVDGWKKPKRVAYVRGSRKYDVDHDGHIDDILTVAASSDGKFVVTGGKDHRMIVWDAETLKPLKVFKQHRAAVTGLAFRRNTNQLYSCSADRTCKVWSLDELAYIETLFGHQDEILGIAALAAERCVTVGSRDRTARLWKVVDETQLVFRGGGEGKRGNGFAEGSMDCVSMVDDDHFVTGSDNG